MAKSSQIPSLKGISRVTVLVILYVSAWVFTGANIQNWILLISISIYVGIWLHEGSHYFAGWVGKSDPKIRFFTILPVAVEHKNIETVDSQVIRFSGFSVFLWIPILVLTIFRFFLQPMPETLVMTIPFAVSTVYMTTSDAIALLEPERYRDMELADDIPMESLWGLQ